MINTSIVLGIILTPGFYVQGKCINSCTFFIGVTMSSEQKLNQLAKKLLKKLGKCQNEEEQVKFIKDLLFTTTVKQELGFDPDLTEQEILCLMHAAEGRTSQESAQILGIKSSTVETHRREIKRKLECQNIAQAVFAGIRYGYLPANSRLFL